MNPALVKLVVATATAASFCWLLLSVSSPIFTQQWFYNGAKNEHNHYPVPTEDGTRMDVHGWLILPMTASANGTQMRAWCSHHVPEFFEGSPHDFQVMVLCDVKALPHVVAPNTSILAPLEVPVPPAPLLHEYTLTPPPPFSLSDLLNGNINTLQGVLYNGSFDTPFERYPITIASLDVLQLTTAVWLNGSTAVAPYSEPWRLRAYAYPRMASAESEVVELYMANSLLVWNDYDQIVTAAVNLTQCTCAHNTHTLTDSDTTAAAASASVMRRRVPAATVTDGSGDLSCGSDSHEFLLQSVSLPGAQWGVTERGPALNERLLGGDKVKIERDVVGEGGGNVRVSCYAEVSREVHCTKGPGFFDVC